MWTCDDPGVPADPSFKEGIPSELCQDIFMVRTAICMIVERKWMRVLEKDSKRNVFTDNLLLWSGRVKFRGELHAVLCLPNNAACR
jgi:hypothetical protein